MQVVTDVEACANNRVNKVNKSVLESKVKTQRIVKSVVHSSNRKIAKISCRENKTVDKLQANSVTLQNQCDQMKSTHAADLATLKMNNTSVLKDQQSQLISGMTTIPRTRVGGIVVIPLIKTNCVSLRDNESPIA